MEIPSTLAAVAQNMPSLERKLIPPQELACRLREQRAAGKRIVQCHGCFDIVHPGHVRYLRAAAALGDVLVVSLTADAGISKGADRPYVPQDLRAENLAALEFVDWVVIDPNPTACELLELLRPDVYVKGREYAGSTDARFLRERETVERTGGRVVFHSGDVVFSSTRLIESLAPEESLHELRLRSLCRRGGVERASVSLTLDALRGMPVLIVGDVIREHYAFCDPTGTATDAPVMSVQQIARTHYWGGAAAVALQVEALGARPVLAAAGAADDGTQQLERLLQRLGLAAELPRLRPALVERTTFVADDAKLLRVTDGECAPLDGTAERELYDRLRPHAERARLLLWCDHGYGTVTPGLVWALARTAQKAGAVVAGCAPPPRGDVLHLKGADLLALSERQLRSATQDMTSGLSLAAWSLLNQASGRRALVSLHKRGLVGFDGTDARQGAGVEVDSGQPQRLRSEFVPSFATQFLDLLGEEEVAAAVGGLALASGANLQMTTYLAAAVTSLAVGRAGRSPVSRDEIETFLGERAELRATAAVVRQPQLVGAPAPDGD